MRRRFAQRARLLGVWGCLLGLLALAGCDSSSDPTSSSPTNASASPSASSTSASPSSASSGSTSAAYVPVKPEFPAAAKKQTLKSAEVFVKYFYELLNYAYTKPEGNLIGALGLTDCEPCQYFEKESQRLEGDDRRYASEVITVEYIAFSTTNLKEPWVSVKGRQNKVPIVEANGRLTDASPASDFTFRVELRWTESGWRIRNVVNV